MPLALAELRREFTSWIAVLEREGRILVTKHGHPVAVLLSIDEAEDYLLAFASEFSQVRSAAREAYQGG